MHASLCDFLSDIVQNAIESGADVIRVSVKESEEAMSFVVRDNGKGMSEEVRLRVSDPFYTDGIKHSKRTVGLGIPFLIQAVEAVGGGFSLDSQKGEGTLVTFRFPLRHIDCPPVGNLVSTVVSMLAFPGDYQMIISRELVLGDVQDGYEVDRKELLELLGGFSTSGNLQLLRTYVWSQEAALDEIRNRA